jgi:vanillate/4-hydroxybenzoate decarboxylase subunit C
MPLFRLNRGDGGYHLDKACTVSRDPDDWDNDNVENAGIYRIQVKGPNRLGIQTVPQHDIALQLAHAEARGEDLPVAIAVGNEPLITLMGATPMLYDQLEYKMAAVMQGKPYKVVRTAKGLDVPWGSEYVLEGRILGRQREMEGPLANFPATIRAVINTQSSRSIGSRIARIRPTTPYMLADLGANSIFCRQ